MENKALIENQISIQNKIYTIRNTQVMLDKDLADFYEIKPTRLREQVNRNIKKFPSDFMFELDKDEIDFMVSQNAIASKLEDDNLEVLNKVKFVGSSRTGGYYVL